MGVHTWLKFLFLKLQMTIQVPWCSWTFSKLSSEGGRYESKILITSMECYMSHPCVGKHSAPGICESLIYTYLFYGSTGEMSTYGKKFSVNTLISIKLQRFRWSTKAESCIAFFIQSWITRAWVWLWAAGNNFTWFRILGLFPPTLWLLGPAFLLEPVGCSTQLSIRKWATGWGGQNFWNSCGSIESYY